MKARPSSLSRLRSFLIESRYVFHSRWGHHGTHSDENIAASGHCQICRKRGATNTVNGKLVHGKPRCLTRAMIQIPIWIRVVAPFFALILGMALGQPEVKWMLFAVGLVAKASDKKPVDRNFRKFLKWAIGIGAGAAGVFLGGEAIENLAYTSGDRSLLGLKPATSIIFIDRTTIKSLNGITGAVEYSEIDAATVINKTLSALPTTGGLVFIRAGSYSLTAALAVAQPSTIIQGEGQSTRLLIPKSTYINAITVNTYNYVEIRDLYINGNTANNTFQGTWTNQCGIFITASSYCIVQNCFVTGAASCGIVLQSSSACRVKGNVAWSNVDANILARDATSAYHIIEGNICYSSASGSGVYINTVTDSIISHNVFYSNAIDGVYVYTNCDRITVTGNYCHNNSRDGIMILSPHVEISGNTVYSNTQAGIELSGLQCNVSGNLIYANATYGIYVKNSGQNIVGNKIYRSTLAQIYVYNARDNCITGNNIQNGSSYGIYLYSDASRNLISGNVIDSNAGIGIYLDTNCNYNKISSNGTYNNSGGCVNIHSSDCVNNILTENNFEEGDIRDSGTNTRAFLNYDPSANAFITAINAPKWPA